jgi:NAD(P)-dependent dehydrogenase (short-subunit alcohol dehydrogenase family)
MDLKGKVALITGGARMGLAVAQRLAQRGVDIAVAYRTSKPVAESVAEAARALGVRGAVIRCDLTSEPQIKKTAAAVEKSFGRLDLLIHLASMYEKTPWSSLDAKAWRVNMDTNLRSAYLLSLHSARLMKQNGSGRIVLVSDWVAKSGRPRYKEYLPYYVSKVGLVGLTEALALELAPEVLVNAVGPGPILKPPNLTDKESQEVLLGTPLRRWGGPDEIARAVLFLVETDFVTGECVRVDGGRHLY